MVEADARAADAAPALREQAEALPAAPGVYLFWGRSPTLPLYIGKSIQLRARVLSHLRDPDSARWVRQSLRVEQDRKSTRLNSSHSQQSRMPSSA